MDEFLAANQALREAIDRYDAAARALGMRPDWIEVIRQMRPDDAAGPVSPQHAPAQQPGQEQLQQPASTQTPSAAQTSQQFTCVEIPRTSLSSLLGPSHPLPTIATAEEPSRERRSGETDGRLSSKKRKKSTSTSNVDTAATTGDSLVIAIENKPCKHEYTSGGWRYAYRGQPFKSAPVCAACYQRHVSAIQRMFGVGLIRTFRNPTNVGKGNSTSSIRTRRLNLAASSSYRAIVRSSSGTRSSIGLVIIITHRFGILIRISIGTIYLSRTSASLITKAHLGTISRSLNEAE
ncbi:hypothetical protein CF319_g9077 [Tilletia indica]|nr:hypothetical protein CF319_g9077 [Tilletia indica]